MQYFVIITPYWKNSPGGGIKNYLINLVEELNKQKISTYIIFRYGDDIKNYRANGSKLIFIFKTFLKLLTFKDPTIACQSSWYCLFPAILYKFW